MTELLYQEMNNTNMSYARVEDWNDGGSELTAICSSKAASKSLETVHIPLSTVSYDNKGISGSGNPSKCHVITWKDVTAVFVVTAAFAAALVVVYVKSIAISLGQKYQLTLIGLLLAIQAFCTTRQTGLCAIFLQVRYGRSTLQNFDGLLRNTPFNRHISIATRVFITASIALPLILSALYKQFVYGTTTRMITGPAGSFGVTPPLGSGNLQGFGASLLIQAYLPFWQDPRLNAVYGTNMLVYDNITTAMLDTPDASLFGAIQNSLTLGQSCYLTADVNATVAEWIPLSSDDRERFGYYYNGLVDSPGTIGWEASMQTNWLAWSAHIEAQQWAAMVVGGNADASDPLYHANYSANFLGIWYYDDPVYGNQTFSDTVQEITLSRRQARGVWKITSTNITLASAQLMPELSNDPDMQVLLQSQRMTLTYFGQLLQEYNYQLYPRSVNTLPSLVAGMAWARIATQAVVKSVHMEDTTWWSHVLYSKSGKDYTLRLESLTLERSPWFILLLLINPLVTIIATLIKMVLHRTPVSDEFGIVTLLGGARVESLNSLKGAGLSGDLTKEIRVSFDVVHGRSNRGRGSVKANFKSEEKSGRLKRNVTYE